MYKSLYHKKNDLSHRKDFKSDLNTQNTTIAIIIITESEAIEIRAVRGKSVGVPGPYKLGLPPLKNEKSLVNLYIYFTRAKHFKKIHDFNQ